MHKNTLIIGFLSLFLFGGCSKDDNQREIDADLIREYIEANNLDAQSTGSGLHYVIEEPGSSERPDLLSTVRVIYTGRLLDGFEFDSSNGSIREFRLAQLIPGWQEGIPLFGKGGKGILIIPSHLGYGPSVIPGSGIPPNSVLVFDMELVDFF